MNVFGEQPKFRTAAKNESWPIKLAMKYGSKSSKQAQVVVMLICLLLLSLTYYGYSRLFFPPSEAVPAEEKFENLPPEVQYELRKAGIVW